jgi:hypothetical protein
MIARSLLFLVVGSVVAFGCSQPVEDTATNEARSTASTSHTAEMRFALDGRPVRRLRAKIELASNVASTSVEAWHNTSSDKGGFEHHECVTSIQFPGGTAVIDVTDDDGRTLATYTKPLVVGAGFTSEAHAGSVCAPHQYPSLSQDTSVSITPDPIAFDDAAKIDRIAFSFDIHVDAVREGASWKLTRAALDPFAYANLNHSASFYRPGTGTLDFTPVYAAGQRSPHAVTGYVDTASCELTDSFGVVGEPEPATYHFRFAYAKQLEAGARVFVKYNERLGFVTSQPAWTDGKIVELRRDASAWTGEIVLRGKVRPVKGYPNANERDAVSEAGSPSGLDYVFRIVHADGTEEWENGSGARWGNYRTTGDQSGRYGYYGLVLPARCDGLNRTASLGVEVSATR